VKLTNETASPRAESAACANCGAPVTASYCAQCGQETSLALPTVRALLREAAGRYVALDGRLWRTMSALLFRPGFLTLEYFAGRRRRYIRPARLFLVLSIVLFGVLRFASESLVIVDPRLTQAERDEIARDEADAGGGKGLTMGPDLKLHTDIFNGRGLDPLRRRIDLFNGLTREERAEQILAGMLRYGPYAAFALLPLFALLLKLAYAGRARRYPLRPRRYAAHLVFGAHNHAFLFLVGVMLVLLPSALLRGALIAWAIIYLLRSMKNVYGGRWSGVFARAPLIFLVYTLFFALVVAALVTTAVFLR
jgi:hypothetical protein